MAIAEPLPFPRPTFWQRRLRDPVVAHLTQGITPEKIALTISIGSVLAVYPMPGATTLLCFIAGVLLRLNQPIIQLINYLCFPLHLMTTYYCWLWGNLIFGGSHPTMGVRETAELMWQLLWNDPAQLFQRFGLTLYHASLVWAVLAPIWVGIVFYTLRATLREIARFRIDAAKMAASKVGGPTNHPVP